jgi:coenzyme F420-0:L-glutamate ligase/coenzyme F420-1:gamma-L-glutamate ligase
MKDLEGRSLEITNEGIGDEISGMANILMGEGDYGTPIVIVRGITYHNGDGRIVRPRETDVIRKAIKNARMHTSQ